MPAPITEQLALANLCQRYKQYYASAARLYRDAFASDPRAADDLEAGHRYNAACAAALAAAGQGEDAARLDDNERTRLRKQALDWLKADLAARGSRVDSGPPEARAAIVRTLSHWQKDTDLAGLRDADATPFSNELRLKRARLCAGTSSLSSISRGGDMRGTRGMGS